jgi:thiol reductant ABC exporter CydC subunit
VTGDPLLRAAATARPVVGRLALALLAGVLAAGSAVALAATSAWLISRAAQQPPVLFLMVAIVAVRAFGISRGVFRYLERLAAHDAAFRWLADLRVGVYERLERLAPTGTAAFRSGDLLSRLVADVDTLQDLWLRILLPYGIAVVVGGGAVVLLTALVPAAGLVLAATILAAAILAPVLALAVARRAERSVAPARGALSTSVADTLAGTAELTAFGRIDQAVARVGMEDATLARAEKRASAGAGLGAAAAAASAGTAVWAALALGVPAVRAGSLDGLLLAVVVLTPLAVFELVSALAPAAQQVPRVRAAARRVFEVIDAPAPVREPEEPAALPPAPAPVRVQDVHAGWSDQGSEVLAGIDVSLPVGSHVGLVGASGAGKSTLAAVLLRFLDPRTGEVWLGDQTYPQLASDDVRTVVGLLAQDAHVFDTTVGENVRLARREAGDDEIWEVLERARLAEAVRRFPAGLDTLVGEHGGQLSGGERQRLALARVLLARFDVVVLDEPTEHLDEETATALLADLLDTTADRTLLLITHRSLAPGQVDHVLELRDGVVHAYQPDLDPEASSADLPGAPVTSPCVRRPDL